MWHQLWSLQATWFLHVNDFAQRTPGLHAPMRLYAEYGVALFAVVLLLAWWWARRGQDPSSMAAALWAPLGALLAIGLNQPLGEAVGESRPYTVFPQALVLVSRSSDFSFPSDHAVMAGAVAAGVILTNRRLGAITAVAAMVLAFARVYVGAHFPFDVIAGVLFGAAVCTVGYLAVRRLIVRAVGGLTNTPVGVLFTTKIDTRQRSTTR